MKIRAMLLGAALATTFSGTAFGYVISSGVYAGQEVGDLDSFVAQTTQSDIGNASESAELAWADSEISTSISYGEKNEPVSFFTVEESDSIVAFKLTTNPSYFLVKDSTDYVLFENNDDLGWGVLDLSDYFGTNKLDDGRRFSHVTEFNGQPSATVPEPSTVALLGLGLVALSLSRHRKA